MTQFIPSLARRGRPIMNKSKEAMAAMEKSVSSRAAEAEKAIRQDIATWKELLELCEKLQWRHIPVERGIINQIGKLEGKLVSLPYAKRSMLMLGAMSKPRSSLESILDDTK